jgi:hypothetical protein
VQEPGREGDEDAEERKNQKTDANIEQEEKV